ncbi:hypothetical protein [Streptomyces sp. NPDC048606]|uniref:hypothetical protein n=1 Tax=Streptomyces sp. NPDC048606 TaxID=3154726 RepID=UPI00341E47B6
MTPEPPGAAEPPAPHGPPVTPEPPAPHGPPVTPEPPGALGTPLATLPGARLWTRRLLEDLRSGRSCVCLFPQGRSSGVPTVAGALLDELLHELADFVLVPAPGDGARAEVRAPAPSVRVAATAWGDGDPVLDYDDGLSAFSTARTPTAALPAPRAPSVPAVRHEEPGYGSLADRIVKELGDPAFDRGGHTGIEGLLALLTDATERPGENRVIVVRGWLEAAPVAATDLLRRLAATVKAAGMPPERRPRLLVLATATELPVELPEEIAREDVGVHWWWGALGRLDTATVVAMSRPRPPGPAARHQLLEAVAQATVVEVCGPFLDLAERLAVEWDGLPDGLPERLRRLVAPAAPVSGTASVPGPREAEPAAALHPNAALRPAWNLGALDRWDGRLRRRPDAPDGHEDGADGVRTGIWLAQNHALLPLLDTARERFTHVIVVRSRLRGAELVALYGRSADMELGAMWGAHLQGHVRLTRPEADRLRTLWSSRNKLAHRTPLDNRALAALVDVLCS